MYYRKKDGLVHGYTMKNWGCISNDNDWIDIGDGKQQIKSGLEIVTSFELNKDPKKDFLRKKYYEKINPEMYVEL